VRVGVVYFKYLVSSDSFGDAIASQINFSFSLKGVQCDC
jgi:cyanate lyase